MPSLRTLMLLFSLLSFPRSARGAPDDSDWDRIEQAKERLARGNFSGALNALSGVDPDGEAGKVAAQVRSQVDRAMAGKVEIEASGFADTQPLRWSHFRAEGRGWLTPTVRLALEGSSHLLETPLPSTVPSGVEGRASLGLSLLDANLWLDPEVALTRWTDARFVWSGQVGAELRWLSPVRFSVRAVREQITVTEESIREHVLAEFALASVRLEDLGGWYAELAYRRRHYSDGNVEDAAHSWLLVPISRGKLRFSGGYGASYSDSQETLWDFALQRYSPYFSPLDQWRHGPIVAWGLPLGRTSLDVKGSISWVDELDPNAVAWGLRERRRWLSGNVETILGLELPAFSVKASHEYEHQIYYQYHQATLSFEVPL